MGCGGKRKGVSCKYVTSLTTVMPRCSIQAPKGRKRSDPSRISNPIITPFLKTHPTTHIQSTFLTLLK